MMKHFRFAALLSAALLTLSLTACGTASDSSASTPAEPGVFDQGTQPFPTPFALAVYPAYSLHPALAANRANLTLAPLLYEPLFQLDEAFQPTPVLCESNTVSPDKLVWTFTLRSGISFSDGTPLTGEAVADALELARSPVGRYQQRLAHVKSITAEGQALTITLNHPNGNLPTLLDIPIALGGEDRPLGTGPYVLSGEEDALCLTVREDWWQARSLPADTLALQPISKSDELIFAFGSGSAALVDVDLMGTNALGYSGNYEIWDYATTDLLYLGFNAQSGPCRDAELRRAIARAIDRDTAAQTIYASHAAPATLPLHPNSPWYDPASARRLNYDPEPLAQMVESLRPASRKIELVVNSENTAKVSAAQLIAYQLEAAGMEVTLTRLAFEDYTAALTAGRFDLYLGEVVLTADFDLAPLLTGSLNYGGWYSEEAPGLLYAVACADDGQYGQALAALLDHLYEQAPIAPICFKNGSVLTQWGRLSGLSPVRGNVFSQLENWIIS